MKETGIVENYILHDDNETDAQRGWLTLYYD